MKHTAAKLLKALCGTVVMLAIAAGITSLPLLAASNGVYIAKATPHYRHPVTGIIEDSGGESAAVLGQSMTESALYPKALTEVDSDGSTYITVRLKLMDNIKDPEFQSDGKPVTAKLMQEDNTENTADYRMKVSSENSVIRCSMFVVPMGRSVIFYITVSNLTPGSDDFIVSVKAEEKKPDNSSSEVKKPSETPASSAEAAVSSAESRNETPAVSSAGSEKTNTDSSDTAAGLEEFDAAGSRVSDTASTVKTERGNTAAPALIGGAIIILAAAVGAWYLCVFRKKK